MKKDVMLVTGAGQLSMAIARRMGYGKKIILGDKNLGHAEAIAKIMNQAGFDVEPMEMDLSSREDIRPMMPKHSRTVRSRRLSTGRVSRHRRRPSSSS